jgi:hypothetical protein
VFDGRDADSGYCVQQTSDGGYILLGSTCSGNAWPDFWLIKVDSEGEKEWDRTYGGGGKDRGYSVQQTEDGGFVLLGETHKSKDEMGYWLIKTDSRGNEQWDKIFDTPDYGDAIGYCVRQTEDGGYVLLGITAGVEECDSDEYVAWLVKTDARGNRQWDRLLYRTYKRSFAGRTSDLPLESYAYSVQQTEDGGYVLVGKTEVYGAPEYDAWLVKISAGDSKQWDKSFGTTEGSEVAESVLQTSDGGYILLGYTDSYGAGYSDFWLIKTDSAGKKQWDKTFGWSSGDHGYSVQQTSDGGYILLGSAVMYNGAGEADFWLVKIDADGREQWARSFGGTKGDSGRCVQTTSDGCYVMVGYTLSYRAGESDVLLVKYCPDE